MHQDSHNPSRRPAAPPSHLAQEDEDTLTNTGQANQNTSTQSQQPQSGSNNSVVIIGGLISLTLLSAAGVYVGTSNNDNKVLNPTPENQTLRPPLVPDNDLSTASVITTVQDSNTQPTIINLKDVQDTLADIIEQELPIDTPLAPLPRIKQSIPNFGAEITTPLTPAFDTYITNVEASTTFEQDNCLRILGTQDYNQVTYLRFDLNGIDTSQVINAALVLTESAKSYERSQADQESFSIFAAVLADGAPEEYRLLSGLSWKNAFGIKTGITVKSENHFDPTNTRPLGSFTYLDQGEAYQIDDGDLWYLTNRDLFEAVRNQSHGNQTLTFLLATNANKHIAFHSSEGPEGKQPQLLLKFAKK